MSGGGGGTTVQTTQPPGFALPALTGYANELTGFPDRYQPQMYPGQTYAEQSPYTQRAIEGMAGAAPLSQDYYQSVLQGDYLGLNPAMRSAVMDPAMDAAAARFNAAGRYGSPASQEAMARAGMQATMPFYNQERQRQQQAAALFPTAFAPELQAGQLEEQYGQRPITEAMQRWEFEQEYPYNIMNRWQSLFGPLGYAGQTQTSTPPGGSALAGGIGGALTGAGIAGALPSSMLAAIPGGGWALAGLGALGGLL